MCICYNSFSPFILIIVWKRHACLQDDPITRKTSHIFLITEHHNLNFPSINLLLYPCDCFLFHNATEFPEITDCFRSYTSQDNIYKYSKDPYNCSIPDIEGTRSPVLSHFYSACPTGDRCWPPQTAHSIYTRVTVSLALYGNFYVLVCVWIWHKRISIFLFNDKFLLSSRLKKKNYYSSSFSSVDTVLYLVSHKVHLLFLKACSLKMWYLDMNSGFKKIFFGLLWNVD